VGRGLQQTPPHVGGNSHLFTAANLDAAEELLEVVAERGMEMTLPKGLPTLEARATRNLTRPDNVFCSASLIEAIVKCDVHPEDRLPIADHFPIVTHLNTSIQRAVVETKKNFRAVDWKELVKSMTEQLATITPPKELESLMEFETAVQSLEGVIADVIEEVVPVATVCPKSKRWWSRELKDARAKARRWGKIAKKYKMVDHPSHEEFRRARNDYRQLIKSTKKSFWENWLEEVSGEQVWKANKFVTAPNSDGGKARVPALKEMGDNREERMVKDNASKSAALHRAFFL
jgi:hypothetical protein